MTRASNQQHAFNAGEWSPLMLGRQDVEKYKAALATCLNSLPLAQGAWTRRPGMAYLHQCRHHDKLARVIPFQYSVTQTYVLEFGEEYIRFFADNGIVTYTSQSITSITKASVGVVTKIAHGYSNNHRVIFTSVTGMTELNNREFVVTNKTNDTFELYDSDGVAVNTTSFTTFTAGTMARIFEVTTAFQEDELALLRVVQSADTLYLLHPDYPSQKLVRVSATSWTLSDLDFIDGPYDALNATATTMSPSAATGTITLVASAVTGINGDQGFLSTDVGRLVRLKEGSTWGWLEILTVGSTVSVTGLVSGGSTLTNTNAKTNWRLGVWSDTTGWPRCGTFYEDRLFLAGPATYPQRLDGSKTGLYTNFAPTDSSGTVADDNAVAFTINADDVNAVQWMSAHDKGLIAGTGRGEWQLRPSALNEALTPTNISAKPATRHGSAEAAPAPAGKAILFLQRGNRKLRELAYVFEVDGLRAPDLSLLAEHITDPSIDEIAYQEQPQPVLWGVRGDGVLLGMTYDRSIDVVAWHRHSLGGYSNAGHTAAPVVESVACVPSADTSRDELYAVVRRYIDGGTKRYVEYSSKIWEVEDEQEDAFYVDAGWTIVNGSASTTISGVPHLDGETVGVYVDGKSHPDVTITNGSATLDVAGTVVTLGYFYNSDGETMPLEGGSQDGSSQGKIKKVGRLGLWLVDTLGLKIGMDADNLTEILVREWGDLFGSATPLFTGLVRERFEGDPDRAAQIYWRASGPFPATVLAIMPQFMTSDDS